MGDQHRSGRTRQEVPCWLPALPLALLPMLGALHSPARCPCASLCKENTPFSDTCVSQYSRSTPIDSFLFLSSHVRAGKLRALPFILQQLPGLSMSPAGGAPSPIPEWLISRSQAGSKAMGAVSTSPGPPRAPFSVSHQDRKPMKCSFRMKALHVQRCGHYSEPFSELRLLFIPPRAEPSALKACSAPLTLS